jgi:GT2 family glycosyltransferase
MSDSDLLVTVVVPTHHRCQLLRRLLASLAAQTLSASTFEVIVVHNYTDDGTEALATAWCSTQPFAAFYFRKNYNGPARSRDFGARMARGRYIAFIDDDCVATPGWLAAGVAAFDGRIADEPEIGLVQGPTLPMPGQPRPLLSKTIEIPQPTVFFETCNMFYRKAAFEALGGFSEDFIDRFYGEDTDLGWKVVEGGWSSRFAPEALVHHEVFKVSLLKWLSEPRFFINLPYLVRKYPALRQHMFKRYFVSKDSCLFNLLPLAVLCAPFAGGWSVLLTLPYFVQRYLSGDHMPAVHLRLARALMGVPRNGIAWWVLLQGSLRSRSFLL